MAFDTLETLHETVGQASSTGPERGAPGPFAPTWAKASRPVFPDGVELDGDELVDDVPAIAISLEPHQLALLKALDGRVTVGELDERFPGSWPLLARLNSNHMLNFEPPDRFDLSIRRAARPYRCALGGQNASPAFALFGVARCVWRTARHPVNTSLLLLAGALALSSGASAAAEVALIGALAVLGYVLHEAGHAAAAASIGARAYVLSQPLSVSIWARLGSNLEGRLFAAAGPLTACLFGVLVHFVATRTVATNPWFYSGPMLIHAIALTPLCMDGRMLLWGVRTRATEEVGT